MVVNRCQVRYTMSSPMLESHVTAVLGCPYVEIHSWSIVTLHTGGFRQKKMRRGGVCVIDFDQGFT